MKSRTIKRKLANPRRPSSCRARKMSTTPWSIVFMRYSAKWRATPIPGVAEIETLEALIEKYDNEHYQVPDASPAGCAAISMEEHGLNQDSLPEIGTQGVVSEILNGKRQLNVRQIQALAARFGVEPSAFMSAA